MESVLDKLLELEQILNLRNGIISEYDRLSWIELSERNLCQLDSFNLTECPDRKLLVKRYLVCLQHLDSKELKYQLVVKQAHKILDEVTQRLNGLSSEDKTKYSNQIMDLICEMLSLKPGRCPGRISLTDELFQAVEILTP